MLGSKFFNVSETQYAVFQSKNVQKIADNKFIAQGTLAIAGRTHPMTLPFTLDIVDQQAFVTAETKIDRTQYGLGGSEWQGDDLLKHKVLVKIKLVAQLNK